MSNYTLRRYHSLEYRFDEFGFGDQQPEPPRFDLVAFVVTLLVTAGIALVITIS